MSIKKKRKKKDRDTETNPNPQMAYFKGFVNAISFVFDLKWMINGEGVDKFKVYMCEHACVGTEQTFFALIRVCVYWERININIYVELEFD